MVFQKLNFIGSKSSLIQKASYAEREKIVEAHRTLSTGIKCGACKITLDSEKIRACIHQWGTSKDELSAKTWQNNYIFVSQKNGK